MGFRARFMGNLIAFAEQQGVDRHALVAVSGLQAEDLMNDELFVDAQVYNVVIEQAVEMTGDPLLGLHFGEYLSLAAAGLIAQITQSSRTVGEALHYMVEFANLGCQEMPFSLDETEVDFELAINPNPAWQAQSPLAVRQTMDGMVIFTLREFNALTLQKHHPRQISFFYSQPADISEYRRLFKTEVRFAQPRTVIHLQKHQLDLPIFSADYDLLCLLVQYAGKKLAEIQDLSGFSSVVRKSIVNLVKPEFPTIETVASNLNMSVRTLQRKLKSEGYTFKAILDELRREFAINYLKDQSLPVKEVAYLLSYSESSAFVRSFKRWYGTSPAEYRKTH